MNSASPQPTGSEWTTQAFVPYPRGNQIEQLGLFQLVSELGAEDGRESFDRNQKIRTGRVPFPVFGQPATGDDVMNVRMVPQVSRQGVEHAEHADADRR